MLLARQVVADPLLAVGVAELVARLLLLLEVPGQLLRIEVRQFLLEAVIEVGRHGVAAQVPPRQSASLLQDGSEMSGSQSLQSMANQVRSSALRPQRLGVCTSQSAISMLPRVRS